MKKLRVGLIGLGSVANIHLEAYKNLKEIEIVAGADINQDRLNLMSKKYDFKGYLDFNLMLEKEDLDIICALVPPRYHREIVEIVAKYKVNILCEKPLAVTTQDAEEMIKTCKSEGIKLFYGSSYRWLSPIRTARKIIQEGEIGTIKLLTENFIGGTGVKNFHDLGVKHYPLGGPGGGGMGLLDHGIHLLDIFIWLMNDKVEYVIGQGNFSGQPPSTEFLTLFFKNGAIGHLLYNEATFSSDLPYEGIFSWGGSWDIQGNLILGGSWVEHPGNIRIHGEKGALRIFYYANKLFIITDGKVKPVKVDNNPMPGNFMMQMKSFVNSILEDKEPEVTGLDGLNALKIVEAAYESFKTKKFVKINY